VPDTFSVAPATVHVYRKNKHVIVYRLYMIDRRLAVLRAVARHGTVTAAAEVCHLTPSAVSHQLQALARELDVVLLEHTGRNVRLTAAANTLLTHADALTAGWERAQADLAAYRSSTITGLLRLCGFSTAGAVLVPAAAAQLQEKYPHLTVQVREAEPEHAFGLLSAKDADIAVVVATPGMPTAADPAFDQHKLYSEPLDLLAASSHPLAGRASIALAEAARDAWIAGTPGTAYHRLVLLACASAGFAPGIAHYADEWDLGAALVARGFGVALVPRWAHLPTDYPIVRIPLSGQPAPVRHILAAVRAGSGYQPAIAAGLDALREIAARKREDAAPDNEAPGHTVPEPSPNATAIDVLPRSARSG
jgi:DNA-binding transcriptional LysR family regulator